MKKENGKTKLSTLIFVVFLLVVVIMSLVIFKININKTDSSNNKTESPTSEPLANNSELIVLYNGLDISADDFELSIPNTPENQVKYEITYYNYENGEFVGETQGKLESFYGPEDENGYSIVTNINRIAMSQKYDAIPRKYQKLEDIPEKLKEYVSDNKSEIHSIDLDGDNKLEYILSYSTSSPENSNIDEYSNYSEISIFDDTFNKIATLVKSKDQFSVTDEKINDEFFCSLNNDVEYIDIDNDGIMEILVNPNIYEGTGVNIYKFTNGTITGKTDYEIVAIPKN